MVNGARCLWLLTCTLIFAFNLDTWGLAEDPPRPTPAQIERMKMDGDRYADQADFKTALEKYTEAYHGVVSNIRGQSFRQRVLPNLMTRAELAIEMLRLMDKEYTPEELLLMDCSYKAWGLIPAKLDSKLLVTELLTEQVAGFYDPDSKRMVLIQEEGPAKDPGWLGRLLGAQPAFDKDEQKTVLAHELTHALQDQLYDLNALEAGIEKDDDMMLSFSALVEGDATLLMFSEINEGADVREFDPEEIRTTFTLMSWMTPLAGGKALRTAPPIFRDSLIFPYMQGMIFNLYLAGQDGWQAVHHAYSAPPTSTEQILHPNKYKTGDDYDPPQRVLLPDLSNTVGPTWKRLGGNCLGELQTSILLKSVKNGTQAAEGWDGDFYEIYRREDGQLAMIFLSIWDSPEDAAEFATAYRSHRKNLSSRYAVFDPQAERCIETRGSQVWLIEGLDATTVAALKPLLEQARFEEKVFPLPTRQDPAN